MSLDTAIKSIIGGNSGITAIVSTRVRPVNMGEGEALPFITYLIRKDKTDPCLDGTISDYRKAEIELGIFADTHDGVVTLSELLQTLLGQNATTPSGCAIEFAPIMFGEESEIEQALPEGEEKPVYLRTQIYYALYRKTS